MATWSITLLCFGVLGVLSLWADRLFQQHPVIPVHWNYKLQPDGFLKRRYGLAFLPLFSLVFLPFLAWVVENGDRPSVPANFALGLGVTAATLVLCHLGHIWAIHRYFR